MNEMSITCTNCHSKIKLNETLAAPMVSKIRAEYEQKLTQQEANMAQREKELRTKITQEEMTKAQRALQFDLEQQQNEAKELAGLLKQREQQLSEAQQAKAEFLRQQRAFEEKQRAMNLTIEQRVNEALLQVQQAAKKEGEESIKLKLLEKEHVISTLQRQIEDLKQRADQGSQQLQGEVLELEWEAQVAAKYPFDLIEPVPKGEHGGDMLQRVRNPAGHLCGSILWELKRTKNWNDAWLTKLRQDQRAAQADVAILVSYALPKEVESFECLDGIWVVAPRYAAPLAGLLRLSLMEISLARHAGEGQQTKMEMVYRYLTSPRFRHRVEAIVEKISAMQEDLDKERKMMTRLWAKREEQIRCITDTTAGMYGDLQGIAGRSFQEIEGLEMGLLMEEGMSAEV